MPARPIARRATRMTRPTPFEAGTGAASAEHASTPVATGDLTPPPTRPALRWFGGKWRLAGWIISHFPPHAAYCEPYGGAASVLLRKPPARLETWNDLHGRLVNFFQVLREQPDELVAALQLT